MLTLGGGGAFKRARGFGVLGFQDVPKLGSFAGSENRVKGQGFGCELTLAKSWKYRYT